LVTLLDTTDKAQQTTRVAVIAKASKEVVDGVKAGLGDKATPADQLDKYKAFKVVWESFKKTRDAETGPAVKAGKADVAKALAKGMQAERVAKRNELLAALGAP
jgi:hypothetical protein